MAELTLEQKQAIARARALQRLRMEEQGREGASAAPIRNRDEPPPSWFGALLQGIGQGVSMGWGDELMAAIKSRQFFSGDKFGAELENQRGGLERARRAHPGAFIGGEIAGNVPYALAPLGAAARGLTLAGKVGRGIGVGAIQGGIYGAGVGEGSDKLASTITGAGVGAGVGGILPQAGAVAGSQLGRMFGPRVPGMDRPTRDISDAFNADAVAPGAVRELGPEGMLVDAGPNLRQQAATLATIPGPGQRIVRGALTARAAGAGQRVRTMLDRDVAPEPDIPQTAADIAARRQAEARINYPAANIVPVVVTPAMRSALATPAGQAAMRRAATLAANNLTRFDPKDLDTQALHFIGQALGDMAKMAKPGSAQQGSFIRLQRIIYDDLEAQNLPFKQAQADYASISTIREALESGQEIFNRTMSPNELKYAIARMTTGEREAFLKGARAKLSEIMGTARSEAGAAYRELAEKGWNREKLAILIGQPEADRLLQGLRQESTFANTAREVTGNSETARRITGLLDTAARQPGAGPLSQAYAAGGVLGWLRGIGVGRLDKALTSISKADLDRYSEQLASMLTATGSERDMAVRFLTELRTARFANATARDRAATVLRRVVGSLNVPAQPVAEDLRRKGWLP